MDKRGPLIGDAASLWNFTPSPGWTKDECQILKLCLMKYGVGAWGQILATGLLPGKLVGQLYGATQRLLGQQSMAAFSGLQVDVDRIRTDNEAKVDAQRKAGLIIWAGRNPTKEMRLEWQKEAKEKYGLTPEQLQEVEVQLQEHVKAAIAAGNLTAAAAAGGAPAAAATGIAEADGFGCPSDFPSDAEEVAAAAGAAAAAAGAGLGAATAAITASEDAALLECDLAGLTPDQKFDLLQRLRQRLLQLLAQLVRHHRPDLAPLVTCQLPPVTSVAEAAALQQLLQLTSQPLVLPGVEVANVHTGQRLQVKQAAAARRTGQGRSRPPAGPGGSGSRKQRKIAAAADGGDSDGAAEAASQKRRKKAAGSTSAAASKRSSGRGGGEVMRAALEAGITQLMDMGFSKAKAKDALQEFDCDVEAAVEYLMQACM